MPDRLIQPVVALIHVLWALPGTVLGLAAGFGSLTTPRRDGDALVFESTRGFAAFLKARGYSAITLGQVITSYGSLSPRVRRHEGAHVRQWTRGGVVFAVLYLLEGLRCLVLRRHVYRDNLFERRARAAEGGPLP